MKLKIEVDMDNIAFQGEPMVEARKVIKSGLQRMEQAMERSKGEDHDDGDVEALSIKLLDSNGNSVGRMTVEK